MTRRRLKLTVVGPLLIGLVVLLAFGVILAVGPQASRTAAQQLLVDNSRAMLSISARLLFNPLYNLDIWALQRTLDDLLMEANIIHVMVRDTSGQVVVEGTEGWAPEEQSSRDLAAQALAQEDIVHRQIEGHLVLCGPIAAGSERIGTLTIAFDQAPLLRASNEYLRNIMLPLLLTLFVAVVLLVALLTRFITVPFRALVAAADEIGRGNLETPVPVYGSEETAVLGVALEHMRTELQGLYAGLEQRVADLEQRARELQVAAKVAHEVTVELNVPALLRRVVALISERFGFDHTGIFLLDEAGEWAVLQAASGEGGQRMLERGHRVRVGQEDLVGYVAEHREPRVVSDVEEDAFRFEHPDLPGTRSELALPLQARGEMLGVLDVQSAETGAFTDENAEVLQMLANQVAMAISNARLFQQAQESVGAAQRAYGMLSRNAWVEMLRGQPSLGYYCDGRGLASVADLPDAQNEGDLPTLSIPVAVRGQMIGTISAHKHREAGEWTVEEMALMETLAGQLGLALESARLYQDSQRRAARERLTGEITSHVRETLDVDTVLQTAVRGIGEALGLTEVEVRMVGGAAKEARS